MPNPDPDARELTVKLHEDVPSPSNPPSGCKFHTRCPNIIPPDGFSREEYIEYVTFRDQFEDGKVDTSSDAAAHFDVTPPTQALRTVEEALELARDDEWSAAREVLDERQSKCERTVPSLEPVGDEPTHASACHLPGENRETYSW